MIRNNQICKVLTIIAYILQCSEKDHRANTYEEKKKNILIEKPTTLVCHDIKRFISKLI